MHLAGFIRYFFNTALIFLVLTGIGNVHSHVCLDGQEPAVSVHFENLNGHPEHAEDEAHVDIDNEAIVQVVPGKVLDQDSALFLSACLVIFTLRRLQARHYVAHSDLDFHQAPAVLLPPLRAPPHFSS